VFLPPGGAPKPKRQKLRDVVGTPGKR